MTKEDFKSFIRSKPELASYVTNGDMTWNYKGWIYDMAKILRTIRHIWRR